eukprot:1663001-Rhodomonas_salina.3
MEGERGAHREGSSELLGEGSRRTGQGGGEILSSRIWTTLKQTKEQSPSSQSRARRAQRAHRAHRAVWAHPHNTSKAFPEAHLPASNMPARGNRAREEGTAAPSSSRGQQKEAKSNGRPGEGMEHTVVSITLFCSPQLSVQSRSRRKEGKHGSEIGGNGKRREQISEGKNKAVTISLRDEGAEQRRGLRSLVPVQLSNSETG